MRYQKLVITVGVLALLVLAARAALPVVAKRYVNRQIAEMGDYSGHVENVDVSLFRGAYTLDELRVVKLGADSETPFLDLDTMDISLQWRALFDGEMVGEIVATRPVLNLVQASSDEDTQLGAGVNWSDEIRGLFPFQFNHISVEEGTIQFLAPGIDLEDALNLEQVQIEMTNLTNVNEEDADAFSGFAFEGNFLGQAPLTVNGQIDPNKELPTFDLDMTLEAADIVQVNPWMEEFLHVDAEQGTFSLYAEFAAAEGRFKGYAKPIIEDADFYRKGEEASGPFRRMWEGLVDVARNILENDDQLATQIPLSGEIEDPEAGTMAAIINILRNAFVAAFTHAVDGSISLRDVDPDALPDVDAAAEADEELEEQDD